MPRPRFSLRTLLILTACLAACCYWRDRPRRVANQLEALIDAREYVAVRSMYTPAWHPMKVGFGPAGEWRVVHRPQTAMDWLAGRYYVSVNSKVSRSGFSTAWPMLVTSDGIAVAGGRQVADASGQLSGKDLGRLPLSVRY